MGLSVSGFPWVSQGFLLEASCIPSLVVAPALASAPASLRDLAELLR